MRIASAADLQCEVHCRYSQSEFRMGDMIASSCVKSALFVFEHCRSISDGCQLSKTDARGQMFEGFKSLAGNPLWRFNC
jgi:hypothetical protein